MSRIRIPGPLGPRFFPEADAITLEEYHRLTPTEPAALRPRPPARRMACVHCGVLFTPYPLVVNPRFCSDPCRRRFHARLSQLRKKAAAA